MSSRAARPRAWWFARIWDAVVVVALLVLYVAVWAAGPATVTPSGVILALVGTLALLWRRVLPVFSLGVAAGAGIASAGLGLGAAGAIPVAIACASVVASGRRRLGVIAATTVAMILVAILLLRGATWDSTAVVATGLTLALGVAVGAVQDGRRRTVQDAVDRAERAESLREAESRRAVAEERVRIARELHDVLAHQIAVVGVQTGVAEYVLEDDPAAAREALATARGASTAALSELATLLQLLRRADDAPDTTPAPSLARLSVLLEDLRRTGLQIEARVDDPLPPLPPMIDLAAYRVLQEGLTNAHKHGDGRARLAVRAGADALEISIRNGLSGAEVTVPSSGWGLVGMRERVEGVGGTLSTSTSLQGFALEAVLPVPFLGSDPRAEVHA